MASLVGSSTSLLKAACSLTRCAAQLRYRDLVPPAVDSGIEFSTLLEHDSMNISQPPWKNAYLIEITDVDEREKL
jgi:hypothetical protein